MSYITSNTVCKKQVVLDVSPETLQSLIRAGAKAGDEHDITFHSENWLSGKWIIVNIEPENIYLERFVDVGIVQWCPGIETIEYDKPLPHRYAQKINIYIEMICLN